VRIEVKTLNQVRVAMALSSSVNAPIVRTPGGVLRIEESRRE
jgi:hypothetical protein